MASHAGPLGTACSSRQGELKAHTPRGTWPSIGGMQFFLAGQGSCSCGGEGVWTEVLLVEALR